MEPCGLKDHVIDDQSALIFGGQYKTMGVMEIENTHRFFQQVSRWCGPTILLLIVNFGLSSVTQAEPAGIASEVDFNRDVRPILSDKCFFCHGPDAEERSGDLRLDIAEGAYDAIVPGAPNESELVARIKDTDDPMPPTDSHKELEPSEIKLLTRWIAEGARYEEPWAYVDPIKHDIPTSSDDDWSINWIDQFVLEKLYERELSPAPDADKVTLVRRLSFDLTGLPPAPAQVDAFVSGEITYESLVDQLIDSPQFGERMAIYWLDLVRFADTVGYHGDQDHLISPYRDYVIASFNQNLPFDQFTCEQIAGDLLNNPTKWQKVASGYNRLLQTSHEGGIQAKEYNAIYAADRVRNLSAVWMGATVGCAQCHDHKYDPYTIRDHYSMAAFFADIHDVGFSGNSLPTRRPPEMDFLTDDLEKELASILVEMRVMVGESGFESIEALKAERAKLAAEKPKDEDVRMKHNDTLAELDAKIDSAIPDSQREQWRLLTKRRSEIISQTRRTMITEAKPPREMRVLPRGNWLDDSGEVVTAAVPEFLGQINVSVGQTASRLDLANWLMDPQSGSGGLTARVFANRFWYLFFGTGISRSLDDFGGQGEPPVNPELLDNLAVEFYDSGWDVKAIVRLLVNSHAYRQSSVASAELLQLDPSNQFVARQSRFRLPAEMIRDNALAVSGLLVKTIGGASAKPYQPSGYYRHMNFPVRKYKHDTDSEQWRRGLYVHWQRMFLHPMMKAMDAPSREECAAKRPQSNTPNAALVLLNDPTFLEAARVLAAKVLTQADKRFDSRIDFAFRTVLSRKPDSLEREVLNDLLQQTLSGYRDAPASAEELVGLGIAETPEKHDPIELAGWTSVTRALLNLSETVTRN